MCLCISRSVVPDCLLPHGLPPNRLLCQWDSPGKDTGVGWHVLQRYPLLHSKPHKSALTWKRRYDQLRQHVKNRDIILPTKVHLIKAMVFPVVMYGCESWTIKKAEHQRIDAFEMLLESLLDCKEIQQSILKEISPGYSLEGLRLKLKLQ